jgi:sugar phosphate isomerase/epimerase
MRPAYQTIIWGSRIPNLDQALDLIRDAGFEGVEFAQPPSEFKCTIEALLAKLESRGLTLLGLAGGSLQERMDYCGEYRDLYLYIEEWDDEIHSAAIARGFRLALHLHVFKKVHTLAQVRKVLYNKRDEPLVQWIPDTAHLIIAGDDVEEAMGVYPARMASVHFADWTPAYGPTSHRYARGFKDLGEGIVALDAALEVLKVKAPQAWIVAEQHSPTGELDSCVRASARWLRNHDIVTRPERKPEPAQSKSKPAEEPKIERTHAELLFLDALWRAAPRGLSHLYATATHFFRTFTHAKIASLWSLSPANDLLSLLAVDAAQADKAHWPGEQLVVGESLSRVAIERHAITPLNLNEPDPSSKYGYERLQMPLVEWAQEEDMRTLLLVPVFNSFNAHHVRFIVACLFRDGHNGEHKDALERLARDFALAADACLNDICLTASATSSVLAGQKRTKGEFFTAAADLIRESIECEGCTIFWVNRAVERLVEGGSTKLRWSDGIGEKDRYYLKDQGLTGGVWDSGEPKLLPNAKNEPTRTARSEEVVPTLGQDSSLYSPVKSQAGDVLGVVRCRNKKPDREGNIRYFTDDDLAVVDAIFQDALPYVLSLEADEKRAKALTKLMHELRKPLTSIRASLDRRKALLEGKEVSRRYTPEGLISDADMWAEWMVRLARKADYFAPGPLSIEITSTSITEGVIKPVLRQAAILLKERGLPEGRITHTEISIPPLYVDRDRFQQVFFNLLDNAIKYSKRNAPFTVQIKGAPFGHEFQITFRDWGIGVCAGWEKRIFEEGERTPEAEAVDAVGQGLGLWIVKRIVVAHGGRIQLTNRQNPTAFTIYLPTKLQKEPAETETQK